MTTLTRRTFLKGALAATASPLLLNATTNKNETLKFIHVTDSHMDLSDGDSVEAMELMVSFINTNYKDLDFVLFGGDNFNNNAKGSSDALKFQSIIEKLHCKTLLVRGNKESSPKYDNEIDRDTFEKMFIQNRGVTISGNDWLYEIKGYNILGLDSTIEKQNNGIFKPETISFATKVLKSKKPTIILNHHPYTNYWKGTEEKDIHKYVLNNTKEVQKKLFSFDNLILTLSGHKHIDSVTQIQGTTAIVTRGFVRPLDLDMYPMRYVEIENSKITEKLIYTA